ncbi:Grx4 family monothiol glutaredoxin [Plasmodium falciparum Santa Lucia]|uniref:Grx4 family monothiol glutaredoxin n=13 Tax=Plasmodium falciparum TaxID=5833 RepID=A0A024WCK4_PLAFA|nr:Grx4 family monothiol glutaredoxin [Plasmodium falciparum Vietnam Oak-Knoll (FVO)]ETW27299.1 Grx4 family monothiol glutaredoxin [Plasmodium falciparum FCH/4]ETW37936.1 Grx4 family monothiol glutaredoxin [Plasmodium falciparum Tanzania (2000708)]ETW44160.1 Grx4 family monothiol glutaredoxin [Plasmodium falciparum NF135/5.C10]ETW50605.1 Grx4 family monothiol glutaredoxin [Plasmodium falciparum MaliPS096_E11]ETW53285.1 Grx4 family monothiol glutaredoxin [Plasmodium falciparum Palo Alto/Uganda]
MDFIKVEDQGKYIEGNKGYQLFYLNSSTSKEYGSHIDVLNMMLEDYSSVLKIYVINVVDDNNKYEFQFYAKSQLIKSFVNTNIGSITSFLRKYMQTLSYEQDTEEKNKEKEREKQIIERIQNLLKNNKIILFMKGTKTFPQCKFSNAVIFMLNSMKIKYETYNILEDQDIRAHLKIYSNWPTYPQLYINTELIGGHDIIKSMYDNNELALIIPDDCFEE